MWPTPASFARIKTILLLGVLGGLALMVYLRFVPSRGTSNVVIGKVERAEEPERVESVPRKRIPSPRSGLVVLDKNSLSATLKMPELRLEPGDPLAAATIPSHTGPTTAVAMLDNVTGETRILTRAEPPPFFQWRKEWRATGRYLFVGDHIAEADLEHHLFRLNARDGRMTIEPHLFAGIDVDRVDNGLGARAGIAVQIKF